MPTVMAITSVIANKNCTDRYDIYVVANSLSDESIAVFREMETENNRILIIQTAEPDKYDGFVMKHFPVTTTDLFKFELPDLLPADLEKVLYLDGDIIVQKDLASIFNENIETVYAGVVKDYYAVFDPDSFQKRLNVKHKDYFNAGVLLLNLKKMREDHVPELLLQYRNSHKDKFMDQDTFNAVLKENVKYLSFFYNFMYHCWIYDTKNLADYYGIQMGKSRYEWIREALIIHFTWRKPWQYFDFFASDLWLHYYLLSPFKNNALVRESLNEDSDAEKEIAALRKAIMQQREALLSKRDNKPEMALKKKQNRRVPMKIAIWGYGKYGHRMFESLTRFCSNEYEVVCVYDTAFGKLKNTDGERYLQVRNPAGLLEDYQKGLFEKVLVCIFDYRASKGPKQLLQDYSIPELHIGCKGDLHPLSSFEQGKKPFEIDREGYGFYVIKNLYGALANYETFEMLYLFDDEGRVVEEHKDRFNPDIEKCFFYDYPFVLRHPEAEKVFLDGQYCILAKTHSGGNYWHFTYNNLDVIWLLEQAGFHGKYVIPNAKFCSELLHLLDIPPERIITLPSFEHNKVYVFEEIFYIALEGPYQMYSTPVLLEAADYIKKKLPVNPSLPKKIYVKRVGRRKLLGADKLIAEYGFTTIVPEEYSVLEQMTFFYNADIVFCVHGANSTNCLYMRKNTVFIEAFSSYWLNPCNMYSIAAGGIRYLPVNPLETVWFSKDGIFKDFTIPEVLLRMTIQNSLLINEAEQR